MDIREKHQRARMRVLQAAAELFANQGFQGTTVRQISSRAGVNLAAVNYYFKSKDRLYLDVFSMVVDGLDRPFFAPADSVKTEAEWQQAFLAGFESLLECLLGEEPPACWIARLVAHERAEPSAAFELLKNRFLDPLKTDLGRLVARGLPPDADPGRTERLTLGALTSCLFFSPRGGAWDSFLVSTGMNGETLPRLMAAQIVAGLTAQLTFRQT